jgi:hypothetical protein
VIISASAAALITDTVLAFYTSEDPLEVAFLHKDTASWALGCENSFLYRALPPNR